MPEISESELSADEEYIPCVDCGEFAADIWLCGEGGICSRCFAREAGLPEEAVLTEDSLDDKIVSKVKTALRGERNEQGNNWPDEE